MVHVGHPDRIRESLGRLEGWIEGRGLKVARRARNGEVVWDGRFELYLPIPPSSRIQKLGDRGGLFAGKRRWETQ